MRSFVPHNFFVLFCRVWLISWCSIIICYVQKLSRCRLLFSLLLKSFAGTGCQNRGAMFWKQTNKQTGKKRKRKKKLPGHTLHFFFFWLSFILCFVQWSSFCCVDVDICCPLSFFSIFIVLIALHFTDGLVADMAMIGVLGAFSFSC